MDLVTQRKWDRAARHFDLMAGRGAEKRWAPAKRAFFAAMRPEARILFLAVGTGLDLAFFPPDCDITGIDISPAMLEQARPRAAHYAGRIELRQMDVHQMDFPDACFDQVFTSCTFCSVPRPIEGLRALHRVLKPGGELHMFEHTGSRWFPFNLVMHWMTPFSRLGGPEMNRDTVGNVLAAGFRLRAVHHVYLDVVKTIHALA